MACIAERKHTLYEGSRSLFPVGSRFFVIFFSRGFEFLSWNSSGRQDFSCFDWLQLLIPSFYRNPDRVLKDHFCTWKIIFRRNPTPNCNNRKKRTHFKNVPGAKQHASFFRNSHRGSVRPHCPLGVSVHVSKISTKYASRYRPSLAIIEVQIVHIWTLMFVACSRKTMGEIMRCATPRRLANTRCWPTFPLCTGLLHLI